MKSLCNILLLVTLLAVPCRAASMEEGLKKAAEAFIIQYHIDENIQKLIEKEVPKQYIEFVKKYAIWGKMISEQRLEYEWKF